MHTRLNKLASCGRSRSARGRFVDSSVRRQACQPTESSKFFSNSSTYNRRLLRPRSFDVPRGQQILFSRLHTTSQSLAPPAALLQDDVDDNDESIDAEIEKYTINGLNEMLPDDIYKYDVLDGDELGQSHASMGEYGMEDDWEGYEQEDEHHVILEETQLDSTSTKFSPMESSSATDEDVEKTAMEMLRNFDPQDPPSSNNMEELQLWLECAAQQESVLRYKKLVEKARDRKAFDSMSFLQRYIVQWYQGLREAIEIRQKEYLSNEDTRRAKKRYGPLLCSLQPEKLAVILSHEAISCALLYGGKNGHDGVPLTRMATAIGAAVETEVVSQRRIKERFHNTKTETTEEDDADDGNDISKESSGEEADKSNTDNSSAGSAATAIDRWKFSASHLKMFLEDLKRIDPKFARNKRAINYAMRRAKQAMNSEEKWTNTALTHLGAALLSILVENTKVIQNGKEEPAFRLEKKWSGAEDGKKSTTFIVLNNSIHKLFLEDDFLSWAANTTRYAPMIVPPSEWVGPRKGGYRWLNADLMRTHGSNFQKEALQHGDLSLVFGGLNILGKTAWKINKDILAIAQHCHRNDIAIGDIPSSTDFEIPPEPMRPERIDPELYADSENPMAKAALEANRAYREKLYKRQKLNQKNMDLRSLRCSAILKLDQAEKFKDFERIYFPYNLDFRGRAYPVPPHLSNVGSDLCRGMLSFADAKPLGKKGLYWLKVHLANFAGKDKMSFDDRAKYVDDNMDRVRASVNDPFSYEPWWMDLDDPFQGLATCFEIVRAIDSGDPETYMCSLPVHMDGSCNGLQHYAALGRDTVGGKAVNLLEADGPQDVYIGVMHEVIRRVAEEAAREVEFDANSDNLSRKQKKAIKNNQAAKLVNGLIDRGVVKRTVMTSVYGVTYIGARQQIQEKIEEKLEEEGYDIDEMEREIFAAAGFLATVTIEVMGDLFQGARKTKSWLAECARLISGEGHPVAWISPIGVPAIQPYRQKRPRVVVTVLQTITLTDESDDLPVHKSRQVTAFPPNYVHSLDSSHMLLTALEMERRGLAFSAVHDSFWTHACDVDEMNEALRSCFVDLYSRPLLNELKESWELRYPEVEFPELPELGDLDLNGVKSATYFFQ